MRRVFLMSFLGVLGFTKIIETKGTNQTNIYIPGKYLVNNYDEVLSVEAKTQRAICKTFCLLKEACIDFFEKSYTYV